MLSPADRALVERDPDLPGLALLLDEQALAAWLAAPVRLRYLRYKAGTGCVLALDVGGERSFVAAFAPRAADKLAKTAAKAPPGALLAVDAGRLVIAGRPAADRDLPAVARLHADAAQAPLLRRLLPGADIEGATLRLLSYKPQRRWVGLLTRTAGEPIVLRAHRPGDAAVTLRATRALVDGPPWTPLVLGSTARRGLVALSWLPGDGLHELLAAGTAQTADVRAAGAALATLHRRPRGGLVERPAADGRAAVLRAANALGELLPSAAARARALADRLGELVAADGDDPVAAHGDFSADQVVRAVDGRMGLIDVDQARVAERAFDLGGAVAAMHTSAVLGSGPTDVERWAGALIEGYGEIAAPPPSHRVDAHIAAGLLRRATEPFRLRADDWPGRSRRLLELAEATCPAAVRS